MKWRVLTVLDPYNPALEGSVEIPMRGCNSLSVGTGWITTFEGRFRQPIDKEGFRIRAEWRFYESLGTKREHYHGPQIYYKVSRENLGDNFCLADCAYLQWLQYQKVKEAVGVSWIFGNRFRFNRSRIFFDMAGSVGLRFMRWTNQGTPDGAMPFSPFSDDPFDITGNGWLLMPMVGVHMHLGFFSGKRK